MKYNKKNITMEDGMEFEISIILKYYILIFDRN